MRIEKFNNLNFDEIYKILNSNNITETQKTNFILTNRAKIKQVLSMSISDVDFKSLMKNRTLQKFRPIKNSFTKQGDKIMLAKALDIPTTKVPHYIKEIIDTMKEIKDIKFLPHTRMEMLKTYVYRHGTKDELVAFLDYELTKTEDKIECLYRNLQYHSGGVADYFIRPIHRMDNKTLVKVYNIINKHIKKAQKSGKISEAQSLKISKWALIQIYNIQNNSKLINAVKTYKVLN